MTQAPPGGPEPSLTEVPDDGVGTAERIALRARAADPGIPEDLGAELAERASALLADVDGDAPELARRLMAAVPRAGATPCAVTARAAVEVAGMTAEGPA